MPRQIYIYKMIQKYAYKIPNVLRYNWQNCKRQHRYIAQKKNYFHETKMKQCNSKICPNFQFFRRH